MCLEIFSPGACRRLSLPAQLAGSHGCSDLMRPAYVTRTGASSRCSASRCPGSSRTMRYSQEHGPLWSMSSAPRRVPSALRQTPFHTRIGPRLPSRRSRPALCCASCGSDSVWLGCGSYVCRRLGGRRCPSTLICNRTWARRPTSGTRRISINPSRSASAGLSCSFPKSSAPSRPISNAPSSGMSCCMCSAATGRGSSSRKSRSAFSGSTPPRGGSPHAFNSLAKRSSTSWRSF